MREQKATLGGDFDADGQLVAHSAILYKDPRGEYVESGMSLRRPKTPALTADAEVWRRIFADVAPRFSFIHQNSTTWHPLAQRYAQRFMRARASGLILGYAHGERISGLPPPTRPMDALTMTSVVAPERVYRSRARVARGPVGAMARRHRCVTTSAPTPSPGCGPIRWWLPRAAASIATSKRARFRFAPCKLHRDAFSDAEGARGA